MKLNLGSVISVASRVLSVIVQSVPLVESLVSSLGSGSGADKKAAVLSAVEGELHAAELLLGHPIAHDTDILAAAGAISDAVVAFHNLLQRKVAAAGAGV